MNTKSTSKSKSPVGFAHGHIGAATKIREYEDRHFFGNITTAAGLQITLAIVADGVGGSNLGQRAAQLTIEMIIKSCKDSSITDIPLLLGKSIGHANQAVYKEARRYSDRGQMSATVSIAALHQQRLYVANVGDSRVYLVRDKIINQLTVDHTWANKYIRAGKLSKKKALSHPNADMLARSVGYEPKVKVDLGLYLKENSESGEEAFHNQGLKLGPNDLVLVCSDGLIKSRHDVVGHYVEDEEIIQVMNSGTPEQAAKTLVDLAVGRNVDDNVTAVVVNMPGRKINPLSRLPKISTSAVVVLSIVLLILGSFLTSRIVNPPERETIIITNTPLPTPPENNAYISTAGKDTKSNIAGSTKLVKSGDVIPFQSGSVLRVNDGLTIFNTPGNFIVQVYGNLNQPTIIELFQAANKNKGTSETILKLYEGRIVIIAGVNVKPDINFVVETISGRAIVSGTIMGNYFNAQKEFHVDCLDGNCLIEAGENSSGLSIGDHAWVDVNGNIRTGDPLNFKFYTENFDLQGYLEPTITPTPEIRITNVCETMEAQGTMPCPTLTLTPTP